MLLPESVAWLPYPARHLAFSLFWKDEYRSLMRKRSVETAEGYSFRQFIENRCLYVHVPKAAGISVAKSLFGNLAGGHTPIGIYQLVLTREEFAGFFKFTFVRNPWDRLYSAFHFLKKGGFNRFDRRWAETNLAAYSDFGNFVKSWVNPDNVMKYVHFIPQQKYLCLPRQSQPAVDFVGYYENLTADFNFVQQKIYGNCQRTLPHLNVTNPGEKRDYRNYYDDETRNIVASVYAADIDMFGYDFENSSLPAVLNRRRLS